MATACVFGCTSNRRRSVVVLVRHDRIVRVVSAVVLTLLAAVASGMFVIVLVTKVTVLHRDWWAALGLVFWAALAVLLVRGARAAWQPITPR
jgi:hypothetical protein